MVIDIFKNKDKKKQPKEQADLEEIEAKNKKNKERLEQERIKANKQVKRNYKLKEGK